MTMLNSDSHSRQARSRYSAVARCSRIALMIVGTIKIGLGPALALDGSDANTPKKIPPMNFASGQQALQVGLDELKAGETEASVAALTYAAANGLLIARWKLGEMYASGNGVPRDNLKAYRYFNQLVEDYDEDQPEQRDLGATSNAFVTVGVYCLYGIPNSDVRPNLRRAHELFEYAATNSATRTRSTTSPTCT